MKINIGAGWFVFVLAAIAGTCLYGKEGLGTVCGIMAVFIFIPLFIGIMFGGKP